MKRVRVLGVVLDFCKTPQFIKTTNGILTLVWIALVPLTFIFGWQNSVPWVVIVSLYANIASHFAAWIAGRVEVKQEETIEE